jgi:FkbM family methyltransferase
MAIVHVVVLFLMCLTVINSQNKNTKAVRRQKQLQLRGREGDNRLFNALTVQYPLHFFKPDSGDWRTPAHYDKEALTASASSNSNYLDLSLAQDQEDVWIYENWFYGMRNGVIMESGALDGLLFSTSYMFEEYADWTAIHVEADPENYKNLQGNREKAINVNGALCSEPKLLHYSSQGVIPVRGFIEFMTPSFIKKWHGKVHNGIISIDSLPTVQCLPVKHLLRELNIRHIDVWVLDTEGSEESVLKGVDFSAVHISTVAMECDAHDLEKNRRKTDILEANGFRCELVERNCMCAHKDFKPSVAPVKTALKKFDGHSRSKSYSGTNVDVH